MMYALFSKSGHLDCFLLNPPAILPDGWFFKEVESRKEPIWSDGHQIYYPQTAAPTENHILVDGVWRLNKQALFLDSKKNKLDELNIQAQEFINKYSGANLVPEFELATWALQSDEAQKWAADKSAATPILDGIATARGMDADKLKAIVLRKALAYSVLSAHVAGQRQALQSRIEVANTQADLDEIKIEFTQPPEVI